MYTKRLRFGSLLTLIAACLAQAPLPRVLIYSATSDFRHESIPVAVQALQTAGPDVNLIFENTENQTRFNDDDLSQYDALVFLSNTGEGACTPAPLK
jgi:hypothetical protein